MEKLHLPDNIKIHFAGAENLSDAKVLDVMGINHCLFTAFPFVERKLFRSISNIELPVFLNSTMKHTIQDSGLFSMLFGKLRDKVNKNLVFKWYETLVEWTLEHGQPITCVEVDAQSIIGVEATWELRERMKNELKNNRIINVFHLQDGKYGLDRLIEFSDYIAIGMPELRSYGKQDYALPLARYIKKKKPSIDIHLLGFTDFAHLKKFRFCTSCDSITWLSARRFGRLDKYHVSFLDTKKVKDMIGVERYDEAKGKSTDQSTDTMCATIEWWKHKTTMICGGQDFKWIYNK